MRIFDLASWAVSVIIEAKILLQNFWRADLEWVQTWIIALPMTTPGDRQARNSQFTDAMVNRDSE